MSYRYDPEADILAIEISKTPFDYAEEMGDFIVHFSKKGKPVYLEILNARKFLKNAHKTLPESVKKSVVV